MEITPLGDSALLIRVAENFDNAPEDALNKVLAAQRALESIKIPGVIEIAPAYTTVAMFYHPARMVDGGVPEHDLLGWLEQRIREALSNAPSDASRMETRSPIEIPVCYDPEFGFDLEEVAHRAGIDSKQVVDLHSGGEYRVHCLGFTGGFTFLGGLPKKLATPRRDVPRKEVPAGSVAIGGKQTGIYPIKSPGGWNVIGRTPRGLFDPKNNPPTLLRAGDRVRFRAISRDEFERSTS
ncbi:MAG TPA: 5-oxoprolinase subunit PxpB [Chthoniobacterales bacterium]|jgi:inhibitor of KinA|nr:5-oxoprolinase subunit PxpB [Chthoniobacterales bacterium]